jgi:sulfur carrier protein
MNVKVNGKNQDISGENIALLDLLQQNEVKQPEMVSIQLNGEFLDRAKFEQTIVTNNDEVDFLYFMGGGSYVIHNF